MGVPLRPLEWPMRVPRRPLQRVTGVPQMSLGWLTEVVHGDLQPFCPCQCCLPELAQSVVMSQLSTVDCCWLSGLAWGISRREAEGRWGVEKEMYGKGQLQDCWHACTGLAAAPKACWLHFPDQQAQTPAKILFQNTIQGLLDCLRIQFKAC